MDRPIAPTDRRRDGRPRSAAPALALLFALAGALASPAPALSRGGAQEPALDPPLADARQEAQEPVQEIDGVDRRELLWGVRLGGFEMINSEDSYDAVFDDPMPMLGLQLDWRFRRRWVLEATLDWGEVDGERVLLADPPVGTGVDETLTYVPLHLAASWSFYRADPWELRVGAGPSLLWWEDDSDVELAGVDTTEDGTEIGASAILSVRRAFTAWTLGGELRWSTFPDAAGDSGVTRFFDEDDLGGASLHVVALWGR